MGELAGERKETTLDQEALGEVRCGEYFTVSVSSQRPNQKTKNLGMGGEKRQTAGLELQQGLASLLWFLSQARTGRL